MRGLLRLLPAVLALLGLAPRVLYAQTTWSLQSIDVGGARPGSTSLGLDVVGGQSFPVASYFGAPRNLKAGLFNQVTKAWGLARIDAGGEFNSMDVDPLGIVHVAYLDGGTGDLKYWRLNNGVSSVQLIDTNVGSVNSIRATTGVVPNPPIPRASYWRANTAGITTPDRLKEADFNGATWTVSFADTAAPRGRYNSLALDGGGNPGIAYYDAGTAAPPTLYSRKLRFAVRVSGNWSYDVVDSVGDPGRFNSVQVSAGALPRVAYIASGTAMLRYAEFTGAAWQLQDVAGVGSVGNSSVTSLALDSSGNPHIAFYDASTDSVKYASRAGGTWTVEGVDRVGAGGGYCFLRLDTQFVPNRPMITYYDAASQSVKIAYGNYPDIDVDGIPDPYDPYPSDPDHNHNGILDGRDGGVSLDASSVPRLEDEPIFGCGSLAALAASRPPGGGPPPADLLVLLGPAAYVLLRRRRASSYTRP